MGSVFVRQQNAGAAAVRLRDDPDAPIGRLIRAQKTIPRIQAVRVRLGIVSANIAPITRVVPGQIQIDHQSIFDKGRDARGGHDVTEMEKWVRIRWRRS